MPNGRHGAVLIPRDDLTRWFQSIDGDPVVGSFDGTQVVLSEVQRLVENLTEESVFVEGQWEDSRRFLVIHFEQDRWLWVPETSAAYGALFKLWSEALSGS